MLIFGVGTHSHFLVDQSSFFTCGFCVFEEDEQKSGFFKPKEENGPSRVKLCPSRVQAVSKVFDLLYGQRYAAWRIGHVFDACRVRVRVSTCPTHGHSTRLPYPCLRAHMFKFFM